HSMSDPGKYRSKEEVEEMMKVDPILIFGRRLVDQERFTQAELDAVDKEILAEMEAVVKYVEESPDATPESLYEDVYVRSPYIHAKSADNDPAWRASIREDRVPEKLPPLEVAREAPPTQPEGMQAPAPDPATAAAVATAKAGS